MIDFVPFHLLPRLLLLQGLRDGDDDTPTSIEARSVIQSFRTVGYGCLGTLPVTAGREVSDEDTYEDSVGDRHHSGYVLVLVYAVRETPAGPPAWLMPVSGT